MTEKEKILAGLLYNAGSDPDLVLERQACKELCFAYNTLPPSKVKERTAVMRKILGTTGGSFFIEQPFLCDYGYNIEIGDNFYANHNCVILDCAKVTFGDNVFISPNCGFYSAGHPIRADQRNRGLEYARPISIGSDVWIGGNAAVLPGVSIGDNVVVGSGSVVTRDIPSGVVAVGNPCKPVRVISEADRMEE